MAKASWNAAQVDLHTLGVVPGKDVGMTKQTGRNNDDGAPVSLLLAEEALRRALPSDLRRLIASGRAGCVVVSVPSGQWMSQVEEALDEINPEIYVLARAGDKRKDDDGNAVVSRKLADGKTVVGLAQSERHLPPIFKSVCEHRVNVASPDAKLLATIIRKVSKGGRIPAGFASADVSVLDFDELCGLVVAGGDAGVTANRITAAAANKTRTSRVGEVLPSMVDAVEFGEARLFAMDLKQDLADLKAGLIDHDAVDKGICLFGPPGTGKTLWVKSLGEYLGIPVVLGSMGDFFANGSGYLDSVIKAQRAVFERARACAPCLLFIDEIDALPSVEELGSRGRDWWTPVINDFLALLDGAGSDRAGVIVVGATNRIEGVSPAVLRPGRMERAVYLGPPSAEGMVRILRHHLGHDLMGEELGGLGKVCEDLQLTGAVIMEHVRSAKRVARRAKRPMIKQDLLDRIIPPSIFSREDQRRIAVHEAGHALLGHLLLGSELESVTLNGTSTSGGSTVFVTSKGGIATRQKLMQRAQVLMAGMMSEAIVLGGMSTGSGGPEDSDLARATSILAATTLSYGMGSSGLRWRCPPDEAVRQLAFDKELRAEVEAELETLALAASETLERHRPALEAIADALQEKRVLDAREIAEIFEGENGKTERNGNGPLN
jgi:hypothetical protein